jgi:fructan beta-fructosidase
MNSFLTAHFEGDALRPKYHFTAPKGWLNDPNGLVFRDGTYHLFYQHNPFGTQWGNMTWGHAVSEDLLRWRHLPNALIPDSLGTMFSGSAVIDKNNTAGFGNSAMVCFYTAAGGTSDASQGKKFTQCLAWSTDGESFHKYALNPVVPHIEGENRDPKVFWHEPTNRWIMVLYLAEDRFSILGSTNLRDWNELSSYQLKGASECPDLFELPLDGDNARRKWVFWAANGDYQIGNFDGTAFHPETEVLKSKLGTMGYAAQTYSNAPMGRCIQISWFSGSEFPGCHWNQQLGFPNELGLRSTPIGPRLTFWPVHEVNALRQDKLSFDEGEADSTSGMFDIEGEWSVPTQGSLSITINGFSFHFDDQSRIFRGPESEIQVATIDDKLAIRILVDRTSIEVYLQKGLYYASYFTMPRSGDLRGMKLSKVGSWFGKQSCFSL